MVAISWIVYIAVFVILFFLMNCTFLLSVVVAFLIVPTIVISVLYSVYWTTEVYC